MDIFSHLEEKDYQNLKSSFSKIAALVGTADGEMDEKEMEWAKKITRIRTYAGEDLLFEFYKDVDQDIDEHVLEEVHAFKKDPDKYASLVAEALSQVNMILHKVHPKIGARLYNDLVTYAQHVAKASGGFMRFFSVSGMERKWVELPMLIPIIWEEEE